MPKLISELVRQQVIKIAFQQGFVVQLKNDGSDQYVKNLMFYSKLLNQFVYIRRIELLEQVVFQLIFKLRCIQIFLIKTGLLLLMVFKNPLII